MIYCFDLDGTICSLTENNNYVNALPFLHVIEKINKLFEQHTIKIFTARGASSGIDWTDLTIKQLQNWNLKYHELIMNKKPTYDVFIDDKAYNVEEWIKNNIDIKKGVIAGCFDVIHPGYIKMFKEAKQHCNHLTIALHDDPSIERKEKLKPILSLEERKEILLSIKFVDDVKTYRSESDLLDILNKNLFHIRFLGDDYYHKNYTGKNICKEVIFINRVHGWSSTKFKKAIAETIHD